MGRVLGAYGGDHGRVCGPGADLAVKKGAKRGIGVGRVAGGTGGKGDGE
jgi:hypothetical protein